MNLQVLIATLNNENADKLLEKMNIKTDAIICNQSDKFYYEEKILKKNKLKIFSFNERGVGLNRNNALMRADGEIVLIADDDIVYRDEYEQIILEEFEKHPEADMIVFNLDSENRERPRYEINKWKKVRKYNCLRYGAVRFAFRLDKIREKNIYFSLLFGGGAKYSSGEDSLFILECLRKGIKVYSSPKFIGEITELKSSWFEGYNEKYFYDKAKFFQIAYGKLAFFMCVQLVVRHRKLYCKNMKLKNIIKIMLTALR